jgi:hypothetical protein
MVFTRTDTIAQPPPKLRGGPVRRIMGTVAIAALLWLASLIHYDRLAPDPHRPSDLVPLGPNDPQVHTVEDLSKVYGISAAAQAHFRVDTSGIHYLRKATPEDEGHK